jgi:hypothetical protein
LLRLQVRNVHAVEQYSAAVGSDRTGRDPEHRGLAGAIWSDDAKGLAPSQREVDMIRHDNGAEPL